ncbi:MAG: hypothetical protein Q9184_007863, partial [Pyrenodesmia sp. 2 TL-2023]
RNPHLNLPRIKTPTMGSAFPIHFTNMDEYPWHLQPPSPTSSITSTPPPTPYSTALQNRTLLAQVIYGLSNLHERDPHSHPFPSAPPLHFRPDPSCKTLNWLSGLALLFVYAPNEAAATGLVQEGSKYTLYWAKNGDAVPTERERAYLVALERAFKTSNDARDAMMVAISMCKRKILSRVRTLSKVIRLWAGPGGKNGFGIEGGGSGKVYAAVDGPLGVMLDEFAEAVGELDERSDDKEVWRVLYFAHCVMAARPGIETVEGARREVLYRVAKVAEYVRVCMETVRMLFKTDPKVREGFRVEHLRGPEAREVAVHRETVKAINTWAEWQPVMKIRRFEDIQGTTLYRRADKGGGWEKNPVKVIRATQHCEITVGLQLCNLFQTGKCTAVEVGCSKVSCFFCQCFLEEFNMWAKRQPKHKAISTLVFRGKYGKVVDEWAMPKCSEEVENKVLDIVGTKINNVFDVITGSMSSFWQTEDRWAHTRAKHPRFGNTKDNLEGLDDGELLCSE